MLFGLGRLERWITDVGLTTCPTCLALNNRIFPVGEGPQPKLHPHCRCKRVPVTWADPVVVGQWWPDVDPEKRKDEEFYESP